MGMPGLKGSMCSGFSILGRDGSASLRLAPELGNTLLEGQEKFWSSVVIMLYREILCVEEQKL